MMAGPRRDALRLARLHLRTGMYALARSELETMAGDDLLDADGILDLAEVRWRTGDLAGADVAAAAWLEDVDEPGQPGALAHAIRAEAAAERGRAAEARVHAEEAAEVLGDRAGLEALLAGIAPRGPWPWEPAPTPAPARTEPGPAAPLETPSAEPLEPAPLDAPTPAWPGLPRVAPPAAELAAAGMALLPTAPGRAAILLALALRADRAAAETVLAALDEAPGPAAGAEAALEFVRAEALRAAGRHDESRIAYASAERLAIAPAEAGIPRSSP